MSTRRFTAVQQTAIAELTRKFPIGTFIGIRREDPASCCGNTGEVRDYVPITRGAELLLEVWHGGEQYFVRIPESSTIGLIPARALSF
jgi:hypothetical protein